MVWTRLRAEIEAELEQSQMQLENLGARTTYEIPQGNVRGSAMRRADPPRYPERGDERDRAQVHAMPQPPFPSLVCPQHQS